MHSAARPKNSIPLRQREKAKEKCARYSICWPRQVLVLVRKFSGRETRKTQEGLLLIAIFADAGCFVVFCTVIIWTVIESAVLLSDWPSSTLVLKVPVKAGKRLVLGTLMLNEQWTLLYAKLFQIP